MDYLKIRYRKPRRGKQLKFQEFKPPKRPKIDDSKFIGIATKFLPRERI
jgi:hypothetical protein